MDIGYILVQAGGKVVRMERLTANKPKALLPVENLPLLFHLFRRFPDRRFIVIADYKKEVLREYVSCFAEVKCRVVDAEGEGTCAGLAQALALVPAGAPFMLIWSDLRLADDFRLPGESGDYLGVSQTFECRWSYVNGEFAERGSSRQGVAGLFVFQDKSRLAGVPAGGELVRWLGEAGLKFRELGLAGTREYGDVAGYDNLAREKCRPFNRITQEGDLLVKEGIDDQGRKLAALEGGWYEFARGRGLKCIPAVHSLNPIRMERIRGGNVYEYRLDRASRKAILVKLVQALKELHRLASAPADSFSLKEAYYGKTMARLGKIRDLIPFADRREISVNGRKCRNVFFHKRDLERRLEGLECGDFRFIHGDCTFSNLMLRDDRDPVFIDPRGYFGFTEIYGDPLYDWAKVYYSLRGNYDRFNLKDFRLDIGSDGVNLEIASNGWEDLEDEFFALSGADPAAVRLVHAVIWLSLTTYAWQDYDSICGAFYNGLACLEDVL